MAYDWTRKAVDPRGRIVAPSRVEWVRLGRGEKCCICGRPDWCTRAGDGSRVCCMRVKSPKAAKNGGWIHAPTDTLPEIPVYAPLPSAAPTIDCAAMLARWETPPEAIDAHAAMLGLPGSALRALGVRWAPERRAWAWPMRDGRGQLVGLRLRANADEGARKWSVAGSRQGLFIPTGMDLSEPVPTLFLAEGPTDTAALLSVGLAAIGRPNDRGGGEFIAQWIAAQGRAMHAVVVLDAGDSGIEGGCALAAMLHARRLCASVRTLLPPHGHKDARRWVRAGADAAQVRAAAAAQPAYRGAA